MHLIPFPEYAMLVRAFFVQRDLGVEVHARPVEAPIEAIVRVGNGARGRAGARRALA
ncbi:MAG: hypothetical protein U0353_02610 [Sandaracinus sp.]